MRADATDTLTIGMATRGEFDGVWFTLTGLTANHPRVRYLVVDNTPARDPRTEAITRASGGTYLHRPDLTGTSAPRDAVFRFADTPWVMCLDSHVVLETGAVQATLDYCDSHPDGRDLIQGPMVHDDGRGYSTHWTQPAPPGLWGTWDAFELGTRSAEPVGTRNPERGARSEESEDRPASSTSSVPRSAFRAPGSDGLREIPMMGLGLWLMRKAAWPGFHPLNRGFGGEEGVLHETVRRRGGKCYCLPALRWRHKFRDVAGWNRNPAPPYPLRLEDHVWNLLVGHRELGIAAEAQIYDHFGKRLPAAAWAQLVADAGKAQAFGGARPEVKRQRILAVWYSDNTAPATLLRRSAETVAAAARQTLRHDVTVSACSWQPVPGDPFASNWAAYTGEHRRGYDTIVAQIEQAALVRMTDEGGKTKEEQAPSLLHPSPFTRHPFNYDFIAFCEHDVLYPPNHFDRIGDAAGAEPPVVSNLDYIGLNGTGWQGVRERHEPLHQLALRWDVFAANLARAKGEAKSGRPVILEPDHDGDRSAWVRIPPTTGEVQMPAVHVNHTAGRFTGHGDVCYEPRGYSLSHPHWGEAKQWWPGEMTTVADAPAAFQGAGGCGACEANKHNTLTAWYEAAVAQPSDFHEHVPTLRALAAQCGHVTEISAWLKPADVALAVGLGAAGRFVSVCPKAKPQWAALRKHMGERFAGVEADGAADIEPTDLLFVDTGHTADALVPLLERHHARVRKYVAVHCTETFGESGDRPDTPGVMHALRTFCRAHPEWVVKRRDRTNHGLMVLSKCPEDVKELPGLWRKAMNYAAATARHKLAGSPVVSLAVLEERQGHCATCEERALDACAACGCPLESKLPMASERCGLVKKGLPPKWDAVTDAAELTA